MNVELPAYVVECPLCLGTGQDTSPPFRFGCPQCGKETTWPKLGPGYLYKNSFRPVPETVVAQIANLPGENHA